MDSTLVDYPPMQRGASFELNLEAVKAEIEEQSRATRLMAGQRHEQMAGLADRRVGEARP